MLLAAVVVLVGTAFAYAAYRQDLGTAHARIASGSLIAETPCGAIEYASAGEGPPVLFVHGAGGASSATKAADTSGSGTRTK